MIFGRDRVKSTKTSGNIEDRAAEIDLELGLKAAGVETAIS